MGERCFTAAIQAIRKSKVWCDCSFRYRIFIYLNPFSFSDLQSLWTQVACQVNTSLSAAQRWGKGVCILYTSPSLAQGEGLGILWHCRPSRICSRRTFNWTSHTNVQGRSRRWDRAVNGLWPLNKMEGWDMTFASQLLLVYIPGKEFLHPSS